jgi:hypothetical protein
MDPPDSERRRRRSALPSKDLDLAPPDMARECVQRFMRDMMVLTAIFKLRMAHSAAASSDQ